MTETEYLHLKKPSQDDFYNVDDFNLNADLLDAKIGNLAGQLTHKVDTDTLAQPNGLATLDSNGKLAQMPTAADIDARPSTWMPTAADVGAVPVSQYRPMGSYYSDGATAGVKDVIYYACDGITTGAYQLLATGNHNPGGSPNYRSVYVAIIGISVGYNYEAKRQVVRCEITPILLSSNDTGQYKPVEAYLDNKAGGSATEIPYTAGPYKLFIRLIRNDTTSQAMHWDVRLHKLI